MACQAFQHLPDSDRGLVTTVVEAPLQFSEKRPNFEEYTVGQEIAFGHLMSTVADSRIERKLIGPDVERHTMVVRNVVALFGEGGTGKSTVAADILTEIAKHGGKGMVVAPLKVNAGTYQELMSKVSNDAWRDRRVRLETWESFLGYDFRKYNEDKRNDTSLTLRDWLKRQSDPHHGNLFEAIVGMLSQLDLDVIVFDEISMVDMDKFTLALDHLSKWCLAIPVGSYHQLIPVGAGAGNVFEFKNYIDQRVRVSLPASAC